MADSRLRDSVEISGYWREKVDFRDLNRILVKLMRASLLLGTDAQDTGLGQSTVTSLQSIETLNNIIYTSRTLMPRICWIKDTLCRTV